MEYSTSLESFQALVLIARRLASFCGMDLLVDDFQPNILTFTTVIGCFSYILTGAYSAWFFYPDMYLVLQSLAPVGIAFQGMSKIYVAMVHRKFFYNRVKLLEELHRSNTKHARNNVVLLGSMRMMHMAVRLLIVGYVVAIAGFGLYPVYMYYMYGERTMALTVVLPGVDAQSWWGYSVTLAYQMFLLSIAICGISASDTAILVFVGNLAGLVDVYKNKLQELDELLEAETRNEVEIQEKLKEILVDHNAIVSYETELDERYVMINFVQVASSVSSLTLSLFLCYMTNYLPGYAFILGAQFQLLEFCLLGTIFSVKNDEIIIAIYNTKWYLLNKSQLKMLGFMFHRSQHPAELTIGGFAPLNIETCVTIMKTIYQYFAMLISFME